MGEDKEDRLWAIVHAIEDKTKKDDLHNLSKDELCRLVEKIYEELIEELKNDNIS